MINMSGNVGKISTIFLMITLLPLGTAIIPATGEMYKDVSIGYKKNIINETHHMMNEEIVNIHFFDFTSDKPVETVKTLPISKWNQLLHELREIREGGLSTEESFEKQREVLIKYHLVTNDDEITYKYIVSRVVEKWKNLNIYRLANAVRHTPINNSILNAMCAISFELTNGTSIVLGLNTFINIIGFDIISFHKGYAVGGIDTNGISHQQTDPGSYVGSMFGFLGYWAGVEKSPGIYSDVIIAGFTILTFWLPLPQQQSLA